MRRRSTGSVLQDLQRGLGLVPRPAPVQSGVAGVGSPDLAPTSVLGGHYAETRNVIPFSFDDSIDPTHALDCFFQMPQGVLKIYSAKLWVKPDAFRAYETSSTSGGGATSSTAAGHSHSLSYSLISTDLSGTGNSGSTAPTTDAQGLHNHSDPQGGVTGDSVTHSHNVLGHTHTGPSHGHTYYAGLSTTASDSHSHTTDTTHSHGIAYGIFTSTAPTGTLSVQVADDGATFGASLASAASITALDIKQFLSLTPGDRQLRISTAGAGALARVKVLLMLDVLLKVDLG